MSGYSVRWPHDLHVRPIQSWPGEQTRGRASAPFRSTWASTIDLLTRELGMLGARTPVLQVAISESDFRLDGYPRANAYASHPGVILSFDTFRGALSFPCDRFDDWQDNVRAIALAMEALRKVDRYGITRRGEQYTGWRAIGSGSAVAMPGAMSTDEAWLIIGSFGDRPISEQRANGDPRAQVRKARGFAHPDRHDGDRHLWDQVEQAARVLGVD
ncbi:MAG: hypothetical protein AB7H92_19395 [Microbacteriaceae bacterium]